MNLILSADLFYPIALIIRIRLGIDGTLEVGISTGVSQSASITGGLNYADNAWNVISTQNSQFEYEPPQITANAAVLAYAGPTLTLQLYGIVGPNTNAEGYLSFDADIVNTPFWTLYGGVYMGVGIDVSVLGNNIASYSVPDVLSHQELLAQSAPLPPTNIVITPGITDTTISWDATLDASKYNLYWSTQAGVQIASSTKIANVTSPFIHNGRTSEQTYYYVLTAENIFEESALSDEVSTTTLSVNGPIDFLGKTYYRVTSPYTGRVWLDRNLGASRVCTTHDDVLCYGDYYQWGRGNDGHQLPTTVLALVNGEPITTDALINLDNLLYSNPYKPYDWTSLDSDGTIRQEYWRTNGVCPPGFRVPSSGEILAERDGYNAGSNTEMFNMFLKVPSAGYNYVQVNVVYTPTFSKDYSIATVNLGNGFYLWTNSTVLSSDITYPYMRAYALTGVLSNTALISTSMQTSQSVRCIMQ